MMEYEFFAREIVNKLQELLGSGYTVCVRQLARNNGIKTDSVVISAEGEDISECIGLACYYEMYVQQVDKETIAADILKAYWDAREKRGFIHVDKLFDWNYARERILFRLVGFKANSELLQDIPHVDICDLSQIFYLILEMDNENCKTITVSNRLMEKWGVDTDNIFQCAKKNTPEKLPGQFSGMNKALMDMGAENILERASLYVVTNPLKLYGAGCILYDGMMESITDKIGSGFYVLPSSVHEVIIVPADRCSKKYALELKQIVMSVNRTELPEWDILSDSVYYYNRNERIITIMA